MTTLLAITTYNQIEFTKTCLESAYADEVVIFDDCSTDGTKDIKEVKVITKSVGRGLTDSWNMAYRYFLNSDHDFFFLANNDIIIPRGALEQMGECLKEHPLVVPMTSKRGAGNAGAQQSVKKYHNIPYNPDRPANTQKIQDYIQDKVSFRVAMTKLNGFFFGMNRDITKYAYADGFLINPKYINVGNDNDLFNRIRTREEYVILCTKAFVFHFKDATFNWSKHRVHRNNLRFYR